MTKEIPNPQLKLLERFAKEFPEIAEAFLFLFWANHRWSLDHIVQAEESQARLLETTGYFDMVELMKALQGSLRRAQLEQETSSEDF
jgi:hypothetical protein